MPKQPKLSAPRHKRIGSNTKNDPEAAFAAASKRVMTAKRSQHGILTFSQLNALNRLPSLDGLEGLQEVDLSYTAISDISALSKLTNLSKLELRKAPVTNLSPLQGLPSLKNLGLTECPVSDISIVSTLNNLEVLAAGGTKIRDIASFVDLKKLLTLYLWETEVVDFTSIGKLTTLRSLSLIKSKLRDLSILQNLENIEYLLLGGTIISNLVPLSPLKQLRELDLSRTRVEDVATLSDLRNLRTLNVSQTKVSQLSPLSHLKKLEHLNIQETLVSDLSALAPLMSLVRGASKDRGGLSFEGSPIQDPIVAGFAKLPNPKRTEATILYLRNKQGLPTPQVGGVETDIGDFSDLSERLEQNPLGAQFEAVDDYLAITTSGSLSDREVAKSPITRQLHDQVKRKAEELASKALRLANQPGWQAVAATSDRFRRLVHADIGQVADQIAEVWGELVSLGSFLEQDTDLRQKRDGFTEPLEPEQRRPLVDLLQTAGPWLRRFPTARELDDQHASFQAQDNEISGAREVLSMAQHEKVIQRIDADMLDTALGGDEHLGQQTKKAHAFGIFSMRNVAYRVLGIAAAGIATGAATYIGAEAAKDLLLTRKAVRLIVSTEEPLLRFLSGLPADIRAAVRTLLDTLTSESHGIPLPRGPKIEPPVKRMRVGRDEQEDSGLDN